VVIEVSEHKVDTRQFDLKSSAKIPLKSVSVDPPDPDIVGELHGRVLADDAEAVVHEVARLHLVGDLRETQSSLQFFVRRQVKNVVLGEAGNVQRLVLV